MNTSEVDGHTCSAVSDRAGAGKTALVNQRLEECGRASRETCTEIETHCLDAFVRGALTLKVALVVLDAQHPDLRGLHEQFHLLSVLGTRGIVLAVNKIGFTGIDSLYEPPPPPELRLETGSATPSRAPTRCSGFSEAKVFWSEKGDHT